MELAKSIGNGRTSWSGLQFDLWRSSTTRTSHEDESLRIAHSLVGEYACFTPRDVELKVPTFMTTIDVPVRVYRVSLVDRAFS